MLPELQCWDKWDKLAHFRTIRAFCNWLVKNDHPEESPLKKINPF
jgi:hypothetical protein